MNMKPPAVVTPPPIYHGFSTQKMFWEGKFTPVNMINGGRRNVGKHIDIKYGKKYITLEILLRFGSLDNMRITSS